MISYPEEYNKVYSYKYRHKIYENTQSPPQLNLNQIFQENTMNRAKTANLYNNDNLNEFYRTRATFTAYLKRRYQNKENLRGFSDDFLVKNSKEPLKKSEFKSLFNEIFLFILRHFFIDHSSRNTIINYKEIPGVPSNNFHSYSKLSDEIKTINRKICLEKNKIVKKYIKSSEKPEQIQEETSKGIFSCNFY